MRSHHGEQNVVKPVADRLCITRLCWNAMCVYLCIPQSRLVELAANGLDNLCAFIL